MTDMVRAAELALISNDLGALGPEERLAYMRKLCTSMGLNHLTPPRVALTSSERCMVSPSRFCKTRLLTG